MTTDDFFNYMHDWKAGTLANNIVYLQNSGWFNTQYETLGTSFGIEIDPGAGIYYWKSK